MQSLLLVMLGGAVGSGARYLTGIAALRMMGPGFPWGTLAVNGAGSFAMGLFAGFLAVRGSGGLQWLHPLVAVGVLGGFTTFSAFSLDAVYLWERGESGLALAYVAASLALSVGALIGGLAIARALA